MTTKDYPAKTNYRGNTATQYDMKRSRRKKWKREMAAIEMLVCSFEKGASIIDVPVGTGRFLPFYQKGNHPIIGIDISTDMLLQAVEKAKRKGNRQPGVLAGMLKGDAELIPLIDKSVDYAICIRLLNWVTEPCSKSIIRELNRVTRTGIVVGFRSLHPLSLTNFVRLGIRDILPLPGNMSKWQKKTVKFVGLQKGRLKRLLTRIAGRRVQENLPATGFKSNRTLYNERDVITFFNLLGWSLSDTFFIDEVARYFNKKVDSYSIYYFKFTDTETPKP